MGIAVRIKGFIPAIIIVFFLSACLLGCGSKGKKESAVSPAATPAEEVKIPEEPGEPVIETGSDQQAKQATQNQPAQKGPDQQPTADNVVVNNYPSATGAVAGAVTGTAPWWNPWSGGMPASTPGNNPPSAVTSSGGIVVYSVGFIPEGGGGSVAETTVGQRGTLSGSFANKYNTDKNLRGRITVNGISARDETVLYPAESMNKFEQSYTFPAEGTYPLWFSIDGLSDDGLIHSEATNTVKVLPVGGGGNQGSGGNQGGSGQPVVAIGAFGYVSPGTNDVSNTAKTDEDGVVRVVIENRSSYQVPDAAYVILNYKRMLLKRQGAAMGPNGTVKVEAPRRFTSEGDYEFNVEVFPDGTQASRISRTINLHVEKPVSPKGQSVTHDVEGQIDLLKMGAATTSVTDTDTCLIQWSVGNRNRNPANGVVINVYADNDRKDGKTVDLGPNPAGTGGLVYDIKFPADNRRHSILLAIDDDKRITKDITVTRAETEHYNLIGTLELQNPDGSRPSEVDDANIYKIRYTIDNHGNNQVRGLPMVISINNVSKRERDIYMRPNPAEITQYIENVAFDQGGHYVIKMRLGGDYECEIPVEVIHKERIHPNLVRGIALYNSVEEETTRVTVNENCRIKYTLGKAANGTPLVNIPYKVTVDDDVKVDTKMDLPGEGCERSLWVENVKFPQPGPHTIMLICAPDHTQQTITAMEEYKMGTAQHAQASTGSGPKMETSRPAPKADACATDIGFIPNGARDYYDVVTAGKKGTIYAVFCNQSKQDIRNLRVQVLVDGNVLKDSVKTYLASGEQGTIMVKNYWFNEGRHKMNLLLDPNNEITETNKNNNNVGHYIDAVPRQQPQRQSYESSPSTQALTGLFGNLGNIGGTNTGGGGYTPPTVYTPPVSRPQITTSGGDAGSGSSSGTPVIKKTPTLQLKGLGK